MFTAEYVQKTLWKCDMQNLVSRAAFVFGLTLFLASCRLEVIVGDGGYVASTSGLRDCASQVYCINDIDNPEFVDVFAAHPNPGYVFDKWQAGDGFLCGGLTGSSCTVDLRPVPGGEAVVETTSSLRIMPLFTYIGLDTDDDGIDNRDDTDDDNDLTPDVEDLCPLDPDPACGIGAPITDIVTVEGRDWAQPDLFAGATIAQMEAVCPEGACIAGGVLSNNDMTGWRWAHIDEMRILFNFYNSEISINSSEEDSDHGAPDALWLTNFKNDGWRNLIPLFGQGYSVGGYAWGEIYQFIGEIDEEQYDYGRAIIEANDIDSYMLISTESQLNGSSPELGGWFYRP